MADRDQDADYTNDLPDENLDIDTDLSENEQQTNTSVSKKQLLPWLLF